MSLSFDEHLCVSSPGVPQLRSALEGSLFSHAGGVEPYAPWKDQTDLFCTSIFSHRHLYSILPVVSLVPCQSLSKIVSPADNNLSIVQVRLRAMVATHLSLQIVTGLPTADLYSFEQNIQTQPGE